MESCDAFEIPTEGKQLAWRQQGRNARHLEESMIVRAEEEGVTEEDEFPDEG